MRWSECKLHGTNKLVSILPVCLDVAADEIGLVPFAQVSMVGLRHKLGHKLSHKYQRPILVRRFLADSFSPRPSVSDPSTKTRADHFSRLRIRPRTFSFDYRITFLRRTGSLPAVMKVECKQTIIFQGAAEI